MASVLSMLAALESARGNRGALSALYVSWVGYCPYADNPAATDTEVYETLSDYLGEVSTDYMQGA